MYNKREVSKLLKHIIVYNMIGIVVFSGTFIANNYVNIMLSGRRIDFRFMGAIFLVAMMAYTIPALLKLLRKDN